MTLRLFDGLEKSIFNEIINFESKLFDNRYSSTLSYNHRTTDTHHYYEMDLPGLKKEDIKIKVDKNNRLLNVYGHRQNRHEKDGEYRIKQVSYGEFMRSFSLDRDVDMNSVKAAFKDGVLVIAFNRLDKNRLDTNVVNVHLE